MNMSGAAVRMHPDLEARLRNGLLGHEVDPKTRGYGVELHIGPPVTPEKAKRIRAALRVMRDTPVMLGAQEMVMPRAAGGGYRMRWKEGVDLIIGIIGLLAARAGVPAIYRIVGISSRHGGCPDGCALVQIGMVAGSTLAVIEPSDELIRAVGLRLPPHRGVRVPL